MLKALRAMRQASREYKPPPVTPGAVISMTILMTGLYFARHGWAW